MSDPEQFTGLYQISKTLRFELKPIGRTKDTFKQWLKEINNADDENNLFAQDLGIKNAYQALKPIMDNLHEQFINMSLLSTEAKEIDFSQYFEAYRKKDAEKFEKGLRKKIGDTYQVAGKHFLEEISKYEQFTEK